MCSYNKINGTYSSENPWLLTQVLRKDGLRRRGHVRLGRGKQPRQGRARWLGAGEMPESIPAHDRQIAEAVRSGEMKESELDTACERLLTLVKKYVEHHLGEGEEFDRGMQHHQARKIARRPWCC